MSYYKVSLAAIGLVGALGCTGTQGEEAVGAEGEALVREWDGEDSLRTSDFEYARVITLGQFHPLPGYEHLHSSVGLAKMLRRRVHLPGGAERSETRVRVWATGLVPRTAYPAHVHVAPCAEGAGGHYKIDPNVAETLEENEIWPLIERTNGFGIGQGYAEVEHFARREAQSVVIHDPNNNSAKMLCADLPVFLE